MQKTLKWLGISIAMHLEPIAADEAAVTVDVLRSRFSEIQQLLDKNGELKFIGAEKMLYTEYGSPVIRGTDLGSDEMNITLASATARLLAVECKSKARHKNAPGMSETSALETATNLVHKMGAKLAPDIVLVYRGYNENTGNWKFVWERSLDGYPFPEETVHLVFSNGDRSVVLFRDRSTNIVCPTAPIIEEDRAVVAARTRVDRYLKEHFGDQYLIKTMSKAKLQIVYQNGRFEDSVNNPIDRTGMIKISPRLAYCFDVVIHYAGTDAIRKSAPPIVIWVDALTGGVIGGL